MLTRAHLMMFIQQEMRICAKVYSLEMMAKRKKERIQYKNAKRQAEK